MVANSRLFTIFKEQILVMKAPSLLYYCGWIRFYVIPACLMFISNIVAAQAPEIEWQNVIGGGNWDYLMASDKSIAEAYFVGGYSLSSLSGDKLENNVGEHDYWVVKINATGGVLWQNTIGGTDDDFLRALVSTSDGGCLIGGESWSDISGDKTENSAGSSDYWIVKLDSTGEIEWQNTYGGSSNDALSTIIRTSDGGYLLGGWSSSGMSGDKTENSLGSDDFWVIKIDDSGSIEWQNTIGGSSFDWLVSMVQTDDGGFALGGYSQSGISDDKSEICRGSNDYWIVKLDVSGSVIWQKTIGGSGSDRLMSIKNAPDGGILLGGDSQSNISGDKTENGLGSNDYWIVKIDELGFIEWQNTIGGSSADFFRDIIVTDDGDYLIGGVSSSNISGDKSQNSKGLADYWIIEINILGEIQWQSTIGGNKEDYFDTAIQTDDGGYLLSGYSKSDISGDKTELCLGNYDYWVVKLAGPPCIPEIEICNSIDDDCDGIIDEDAFPAISISAAGATTFCQGSNVILTATHTGIGLQWKKNGTTIPGATGVTYSATTTGGYTCESSSACGATLSASISVTANKNPPASITAGGPTSFCAGGSVVLTANIGGGLSYQWYKGATALAGATSISYTATTTGNYKCRVTRTATGCYKNSNTIAVTIVCREGQPPAPTLETYPNPATTELYITCSAVINTAQLYNELGQLIMEISVSDGYAQADISALSAGMYILRAGGEVVQWVKQ